MNKYLEKIAESASVQGGTDSGYTPARKALASTMLAGLGAHVTSNYLPSALGYTKVYHGTSASAVDSIMNEGLDPSRGGSGVASNAARLADESTGKVHVSRYRQTADMYSRMFNGGTGSAVVTARIPTSHWDRMRPDKHVSDGLDKYRAATTTERIDPKYLARRPLGGIAPHLSPSSILNHLRSHPGGFAKGSLGVVGGIALTGLGAYNQFRDSTE